MSPEEHEQPPAPGHGFPAGGVFNAAVDAVVVMSADGRVRDWNPAAERLFGYRHADAVGRELASLIIPAALRDGHRAALARYLETRRATVLDRRLELFANNAKRDLLPVELTVTRIPDSEPPLFAGFVRARAIDDPPESSVPPAAA
jgi:PAS domain S-box-containing protein